MTLWKAPCLWKGSLIASMLILLSSYASGTDLARLSEKCTQGNGDSCSKLEKELRRCKNFAECSLSLEGLPDTVLSEISSDNTIRPEVRSHADKIIADRKQQRAARELRKANFSRLKVGMTLAEVETTIGPLDQNCKAWATLGAGLSSITNPVPSSFSCKDHDEDGNWTLVFENGKLKDFQH